jgi:hypothetical protein
VQNFFSVLGRNSRKKDYTHISAFLNIHIKICHMYGIKIRPGHWNLHSQWGDQTPFAVHKQISMLAVAWVIRWYWRFFSGMRETELLPLNRI